MRLYFFTILGIFSISLCTEGWIEIEGMEISDHELTILIKEDYAPLLGIEPPLELSSIPVLNDAVSSFNTKELLPLFTEFENFTQIHRDYNLHRYYTLRIDPQNNLTELIDEVREIMQATSVDLDPDGGLGTDGYDVYTGYGRINANNALNYILSRKYYHSGWNWVGFPWLLDNEDGVPGNNPDPVEDIFNAVENEIDYITIIGRESGNEISAHWNGDWWNLSDGLTGAVSTKGYKVEMPDDQDHYEITFAGERVPEDTSIDLVEGENWIPYFLPFSQHPSNAFPQDVLDLMSSIMAEDWFMIRRNGEFYIKVDCPPQTQGNENECFMLDYGAMYIVQMNEAISFSWNIPGDEPLFEPNIPEIPANFIFEKKKDYIPIVVESIESVENIENVQEIGAKKEGEYVGAEVIYGYPINLRVYDNSLSNITFEITLKDGEMGRQEVSLINKLTLGIKDVTYENGVALMNLIDIGNIPEESPKLFSLVSAYPNPMNPGIEIHFSLLNDAVVELGIYDIMGHELATLLKGRLISGNHSFQWNGFDKDGFSISSGVYFYRLESDGEVIKNKIMLLK